ncbi:hypothetical protein GCM10022380_41780 [Amycolatopsis tucumanensis]|uniref:1-phosphofructokinase n=1 Tax=Amycolatopsis tucumanensis TaxID=401106 RepID=A0ABP7IHK6_9PSEU
MIVTVTPNPSLDHTVEVDALRRGEVLRAGPSRLDPGGKGVNVARALAAHGRKTAVGMDSPWRAEVLRAAPSRRLAGSVEELRPAGLGMVAA